MKYFIIAGEASGDLHASNLIKSLKKEDSQASFCGLGGDLMAAEGVRLVRHYRDMAFMGFIPFTVAMAIIATILYFSYPLVGFLLTILGFIPLVLEFLMYKQFIDPLFIGHKSHNVIATRSPKGAVKKRIILVAHADSQYEWILNYKLGGVGMKLFLIPGVVGLIICSAMIFE